MASKSNSYNKTILIGRLGQDPEYKQGKTTPYARFQICNSSVSKDGTNDVQWHRVCAFGKQASICHDYLHKGDLCCIEGRLDAHFYEKDGIKREYNSVIAEKITFLSSRRRVDQPVASTTDDEIDAAF